MVSLFNNKVRPIGLDIGHNSIKMIQLVCSKDKVRVAAADEIMLENFSDNSQTYYAAVSDAIAKIMQKGQFRGREVISCLSNDQMKIKSFRLDGKDVRDIDTVVESEAKSKFGMSCEEYHIDYISAGSVRQGDEFKKELILFTAHKQAIKEHIEVVEKAGLRPVGIDSVPCALFRCFSRGFRRQEDGDVVNVFVDLGSYYTTLIIVKGHEICFIKQIPIGGRELNKNVAAKLGISTEEAVLMRTRLQSEEGVESMDAGTRQIIIDAMNSTIDELTREIMLCFKYFAVTFRGIKPQRAVFSGGEACEQMLIDSLSRNLSVNVEIGKPLRGLDIDDTKFADERRRTNCQWAVAVGLGLKGMNSDDLESLN